MIIKKKYDASVGPHQTHEEAVRHVHFFMIRRAYEHACALMIENAKL